jgi:MoaA/NifB/PqqE/SkfB family radical SAM enzyme
MPTATASLLPGVQFDHRDQCYKADPAAVTDELVASMSMPLSATYQLTRDCNLRCTYCSEPPGIRTSSLAQHKSKIDRLAGMRRIILSGGEPMDYPHFWDILEYVQGKFEIVVLSTNATRIKRAEAERLVGMVDYVDVTVDGPRRQHNRIRGQYDAVIDGLMHLRLADIPLSVICVYMPAEQVDTSNLLRTPRPGNRDVMHYICQTGDMLGARKVKILTPIPKGRSATFFEEFATGPELDDLATFLAGEKQKNGWKTRIVISDWMRIGQGHAWLIEPDGRVIASPVWDHPECYQPFGNLAQQTGEQLWQAYRYKREHLAKYLERTLIVR